MKRIVILSDLHCGHLAGLTPPGWQLPPRGEADDPRIQWGRLMPVPSYVFSGGGYGTA
ncbi:hypothetical protein [Oleidesulfovibrio sp.]|uniref:hypothetical protein n=1 Tax=Oleidesulfovibrio sp. TaxID=2909707 RepID=UPI003A8800A2